MGTLQTTSIMIKLLLGSALLALTAAEADPQLLYGAPYAAAPATFAPVGAVPKSVVVKSDVITPAEVSHEVAAHTVPEADAYYGYYGYPYGYRAYGYGYGYPYRYGYYGKRSADAEPAVLAGASRVLTPPTPLIHNPPALPVAYAHPLAYAVNPLAYPVLAAPAPAEEPVVAERKKREADPQLLLNGALPYAAPVLAPVGAVAHAPVVKSVVDTPAEVSHEVTAHALPVAVGYHGVGYGYPYYG